MKTIYLTLLLCAAGSIGLKAQTGTISTVAGGQIGDGNPATSAAISVGAAAVVVDASGNIFIADNTNNRVRKVNISGIISTLAGNGISGYSGDGGQAIAAELNAPVAVAVDGSGNVYVADATSNRIRKITTTSGIITTFAGTGYAGYAGDGGLAVLAELYTPQGIAFDGTGNLFISDNGTVIRKVNTSGIISTYAGMIGYAGYIGDGGQATAAELYLPEGLAVNTAGDLYIADYFNYVVRKVTASSGIITTFAGNGVYGYSSDGGLADTTELSEPSGVSVDASGNVFITDTYNSRIRKVTISTGIITTYAGNGVSGYTGDGGLATSAELISPTGIAFGSSGNLYFADGVLRKINTSSGIINTSVSNQSFSGDGGQATMAALNAPTGILVDGLGNMFITDLDNNRIRMVSTSGSISTIAGNGIAGYSGDGGQATNAELNYPYGVALDATGNIIITDASNNRLRKLNVSSGVISTIAGTGFAGFSGDGGPATSAEIDIPYEVTLDGSGNIYFTDWHNSRIRKIDGSGNISTIAGNGKFGYTSDGGLADTTTLNRPVGIVIDGSGNIYFSDEHNYRIREISSSGIIRTIAGNGRGGYSGDGGPAIAAEINAPHEVALDASGNVYLADWNARIRVINTHTGIISTIAGDGNSGFNGDGGPATNTEISGFPIGICLGSTGNLYIADDGNNRIRKIAGPLGIRVIEKDVNVLVYPNPFTSTTNIVVNTDGKHYLEVFDITGRSLEWIEFIGKQYELSSQGLAKGLYFIRVLDGSKQVMGNTKIVVQ